MGDRFIASLIIDITTTTTTTITKIIIGTEMNKYLCLLCVFHVYSIELDVNRVGNRK